MRDAEPAIATLRSLKRMGVRVAVDDFGTGYSSLVCLRQLPLDLVKIARPFLERIDVDPKAEALARALVEFGRSFGLSAVAEGIETPGQLARLVELGCEYGQGFLLGRPLEAEAVEKVLRDDRRRSATDRLRLAG